MCKFAFRQTGKSTLAKGDWLPYKWGVFHFFTLRGESPILCLTKYVDKVSAPTVSNVTDRGGAMKRPDHQEKQHKILCRFCKFSG